MEIQRFRNWIHCIENTVLSLFLSILIVLSFLQIISRLLFDTGLNFIDSINYQLVLWIGLLGAAIATRTNEHINIDVMSRILPIKWQYIVNVILNIFSSLICAVAAWASFRFIMDEMNYGYDIVGSIPSWVFASIIPFSFSVISIRFIGLMIENIQRIINSDYPSGNLK